MRMPRGHERCLAKASTLVRLNHHKSDIPGVLGPSGREGKVYNKYLLEDMGLSSHLARTLVLLFLLTTRFQTIAKKDGICSNLPSDILSGEDFASVLFIEVRNDCSAG